MDLNQTFFKISFCDVYTRNVNVFLRGTKRQLNESIH